tara:strand:+ start:27673 stop:27843 length:171 start_codon:yes stop_codon:yes gene_type:complete
MTIKQYRGVTYTAKTIEEVSNPQSLCYRGVKYNSTDINHNTPVAKSGIYRGFKWSV